MNTEPNNDQLIITNPELELLRAAHGEITMLYARHSELNCGEWDKLILRERMAIRDSPTPEAIDRLLMLLQNSSSEPRASLRFEHVRQDIALGARNVFDKRARTLVVQTLTRALDQANCELDARRELDEERQAESAQFLAEGQKGPSAEALRLSNRALRIHRRLAAVNDETQWQAFPPDIAATLADADVFLDRPAGPVLETTYPDLVKAPRKSAGRKGAGSPQAEVPSEVATQPPLPGGK